MMIQPVIRPRKKRLVALFVGLFLLIFLGCSGISTYVGWNLTHPDREPIVQTPQNFGLVYETVQFENISDGTRLHGWLIPESSKKKIVIFAHGYARNRSYHDPALPTAQALHEKGIASLLFDFRNSGESEGDLTTVGQFEKSDLLSAILYVKNLGYESIGIVGYSMGAATAIVALPETDDVDVIVADSPFSSLRPYLENNLPVWSHLPGFPFTPMIMNIIPWLTGMDPDAVNPLEAIQQMNSKPVLLIHAVADNRIPVEDSRAIYDRADKKDVELWITGGDKHVGSYSFDSAMYLERVTAFLVKHL